jgi:hypothetical protein
VLVLGGDEGPAARLVEALGAERASAVGELMRGRARAWASDAFGPGAVRLVADSSFATALEDGGSTDAAPVVAIRPELPAWHPELAADVIGDLEAGCALSLAPMFDGGLYLLALAGPVADRVATLAALDLAGPGAMSHLLALAQSEGWEVGLLRAERGLRRARDVRALLADPLTDPELRALLE